MNPDGVPVNTRATAGLSPNSSPVSTNSYSTAIGRSASSSPVTGLWMNGSAFLTTLSSATAPWTAWPTPATRASSKVPATRNDSRHTAPPPPVSGSLSSWRRFQASPGFGRTVILAISSKKRPFPGKWSRRWVQRPFPGERPETGALPRGSVSGACSRTLLVYDCNGTSVGRYSA